MFQLITSLVLASLIFPAGANFFTETPVDFSYAPVVEASTVTPQRLDTASLGIETTAENILVVDEASGQELYTKNSSAAVPEILEREPSLPSAVAGLIRRCSRTKRPDICR